MPVPPPPPPPPPTFSQANIEKPSLNRSEQSGRNALLSDINKGRKLKKAVTNDRSIPILDNSVGSRPPMLPPGGRTTCPRPFVPPGASPRGPAPPMGIRSSAPETPRSRMPPQRADFSSRPEIVAPSVPNTPRPIPSSLHNRAHPPVPVGNRQTSPASAPSPITSNKIQGFGGVTRQTSSSLSQPVPPMNRPPLPMTPSRVVDDRPPPPPTGNRPPLNRDVPPPPPPQNNKPPIPSTPRPISSSQPPPLPPGRPGPPPIPPTPSAHEDMPRLPLRNSSLSGQPPPPPPPVSRNGTSSRGPAVPQLPSRGGPDIPRSGQRPPPPPERPGLGSLPPPPPPNSSVRNGFQDPSCEDELERRFSFHPSSDFPPPEPYVAIHKSYPSKLVRGQSRSGSGRKERGAPPLPPIPR
ncbi:hypothetical protein FKM82_015650 [Ascaphus truei]